MNCPLNTGHSPFEYYGANGKIVRRPLCAAMSGHSGIIEFGLDMPNRSAQFARRLGGLHRRSKAIAKMGLKKREHRLDLAG
jgi:hypothetical protein